MEVSAASIIQNIINALQWGSFYALIALGYTLVYGVLTPDQLRPWRCLYGRSLYCLLCRQTLSITFLTTLGLPGWVALALCIPLTMILTSLVGVTLERIAYRPLRRKGAHRLYVVITALMCGLILENGNLAILGASRKAFPSLVNETVYSLGGVTFTNLKVAVILTAIVVFLFLQWVVTKTRVGMAMRAISYDKFAIPLMGIPLDHIIVVTFILGSGFAGLAGLLFAMSYPVLEPYMGALIGWKAFIAAVVGGIGDIRGAFIGGFLLGAVEIMVVAFFPSTFRDLIAFAVLLAILTWKPTGLFGIAKTTKI